MAATTAAPSPAAAQPSAPVLETHNLAKDFGPVRVLHDVHFALLPGEVHALIGENGAGKSTLMKILSGYLAASEGHIVYRGEQLRFASSRDAEARGIVLIHQELNLAEDLSVEENIFLGRELHRGPWLRRRAMLEASRKLLEELETPINPQRKVRDLSVSQKQMVEIAKAISREAQLLIMDEPTDVLTGTETEVLFRLIARLQAQGVTIVYISHKLGEVKRIADRVTVLRDGHIVRTQATQELSERAMANLMIGRDLSDMYPEKRPLSADAREDIVLAARDVHVPAWVSGAGFDLRRGEILGFAGLVGAGRSELFEGILGLRLGSHARLWRQGQPLRLRNLRDASRAGIVYLSEDRKGKGLLVDMRLRPNVTLLALEHYAKPFINSQAEQRALQTAVEDFSIRVPSLQAKANTLSGGNQQKLVLAKIMEIDPEVIILDEPTRGIDIATKRQIYFFIHELTAQGKSCIFISSEMSELIGLCHRVVVMHAGKVAGVLEGEAINESNIVQHATGLERSDSLV